MMGFNHFKNLMYMMEFHHIMMLIHHKIDDPINYSIAMLHCELVCVLPGRWPSHACTLRGNHWAGSPKPSKNRKISSGVRQVKKTFSMSFSAISGSLSISNNLALNAEDDFDRCVWWIELELDFSPHLEAFENIKVAVVLICQLLVPV